MISLKKLIKEEIDINKLRNHADVTIAGIHEQPGYIIMDLLNPATRQKALKNLLSRGYHVNKIDGIKTNYGLKIEK